MGIFKSEVSREEMLFGRALEYVKSQNWKYTIKGDSQKILELQMGIKGKMNNCRVVIAAGEKEIQTYAFVPLKASEENYAAVVEFITRANYNLKHGSFEFDYRDGEVRYHTCLSCAEGVPSLKDVELNVDIPILMLQRYGDALLKVLMGFGNPAEELAAVE